MVTDLRRVPGNMTVHILGNSDTEHWIWFNRPEMRAEAALHSHNITSMKTFFCHFMHSAHMCGDLQYKWNILSSHAFWNIFTLQIAPLGYLCNFPKQTMWHSHPDKPATWKWEHKRLTKPASVTCHACATETNSIPRMRDGLWSVSHGGWLFCLPSRTAGAYKCLPVCWSHGISKASSPGAFLSSM